MTKKKFLLFLFLTLFTLKISATHIVGGEIYYDNLGGNNYRITLKVYRDCFTGLAPYDNPATIFIFDAVGTFVDSVEIPFPGSDTLPVTINNPCFSPPTNICVEAAIYQTVINLPNLPGGYNITYQRCCRNGTILNLNLPGNVGSTYMAHIPDNSVAPGNSSPRFTNFPPIFLCLGVPLNFDHSATDPDGDSLYYELCDPFDGLSSACPILGSAVAAGCPNIASPPPYPYVPWLAPYSATFPMSSSPAITVDPITGLMTGTPNMLGQWVVGVCVSEYRAGVLIDVNKRDFQFNVVNCPGLPVASIPMQTIFCFGYNVNFTQASLNASTYHWDFGDPTTVLDTSNIFAPTWTYADSGTYVVTLIINPGTPCADTNTTTFYIYPLLDPDFVPPPPQCAGFGNNFIAGGAFMGNGTFTWNFGPSASPSTSNLMNPVNIIFNSGGTFPVTLTVSENGCTQTYIDSVHVYPSPIANFGMSSSINCITQPVQFIDSSLSSAPLTYQWDFGNGSTSTIQNPIANYPLPGTYSVTLIVTSSNGCNDTVQLPVPLTVLPPPVANFTFNTNCFSNLVNFTDASSNALTYQWNFGDLTTTLDASVSASPGWVYPDSGTYVSTLIINQGTVCADTQAVSFYLNLPLIPNLATPPGQCIYNNNFNFTPGGSYMGNGTFNWNFGTHASPSSSNVENPTNIIFDTVGTFPVTITITENGCTASDTTYVTVYPKPDALFDLTTTFGCTLNPVHFIDLSTGDAPLSYVWDFGNGTGSTLQNPYAVYTIAGTYMVSLIVTTPYGCMDSVSLPSPLSVYTSPVAGFNVSPTYTSIFYPDITMTDQSLGASGCSVYWGDGTSTTNCDTIHQYAEAGTYTIMQVVVNSFGCYDTAYAQVIVDPEYLFWIPNAFTPNANGNNDVFKPKLIGVHKYSFLIFNRWGEKIFETTNLEEGWNGFYKSKLCEQDVYVYKIDFTDDVHLNEHEFIGRVTLLR